MRDISVDILLATYNGEHHLSTQLNSIINQSHTNWRIYARDDGSTDATKSILETFRDNHPNKIVILEDSRKNVGARENFSILMTASKSDYIFFCDQDDFWLSEKLEKTLEKLIALENQQPQIPCFVFSDLSMADENLNIIAPSLWKKDKLNPNAVGLGNLLMQNVPYGCAMAINKALLNLGTPIDSKAILQDHWLVLLAAATGKINHLAEPTILHRIHQNNASRAADPLKKEIGNDLNSVISNKNMMVYLNKLQNQALGIKERLEERKMGLENIDILDAFIKLRQYPFILRKYNFIKYRFFKNQLKQTIKWLIRI